MCDQVGSTSVLSGRLISKAERVILCTSQNACWFIDYFDHTEKAPRLEASVDDRGTGIEAEVYVAVWYTMLHPSR